MKSVTILIASVFLVVASSVAASPVIVPEKAMVIDGIIAQGNILPLGKEMLDRAEQGVDEVQLIINSPGGEVVTGFLFLNLMKSAQQLGLKVTCFVPTIAASMAYQILLNCDERHTLNHSFLLWHRARVNVGGMFGAPMTAPQALTLGRDLQALDNMIFNEVVKYMGREVSADVLEHHFEAETLHTGYNLHSMAPRFIMSHSAVRGLFEALLGKVRIMRNEVLDRKALDKADFIYITNKVQK